MKFKEWGLICIITLVASVTLLLFIEMGVRFFWPEVNAQDTDARLFREKAFGDTVGLVPNAQGQSFGVDVSIDDMGFRRGRRIEHSQGTWLFLGDSVTFGVGVAEDKIFPQLLQERLGDVRILNSAVTGYSAPNYYDVVAHMLDGKHKLDRVLLFYTLNDAYDNFNALPKNDDLVGRMLGLLRRYSRLYVLTKDLATDRSKVYFMYDYAMYAEGRHEWIQATTTIGDIAELLRRHKIPFDVVLLPYEYQLRMRGGAFLHPQDLVARALRAKNINVIDLYDDFANRQRDSRSFFLFGDPMHLSALGHQVVCDALTPRLRK